MRIIKKNSSLILASVLIIYSSSTYPQESNISSGNIKKDDHLSYSNFGAGGSVAFDASKTNINLYNKSDMPDVQGLGSSWGTETNCQKTFEFAFNTK